MDLAAASLRRVGSSASNASSPCFSYSLDEIERCGDRSSAASKHRVQPAIGQLEQQRPTAETISKPANPFQVHRSLTRLS